VTATITTAVIMIVAAVSPHHAWQQPILRFADTAVGVVAAWVGLRVIPGGARPPLGKQDNPAG
jgi:hypothetical protein